MLKMENQMNLEKPNNLYEAVVMGLFLSVTAPHDKKSEEARSLTESLMEGLSKTELDRAFKEAEQYLKIS